MRWFGSLHRHVSLNTFSARISTDVCFLWLWPPDATMSVCALQGLRNIVSEIVQCLSADRKTKENRFKSDDRITCLGGRRRLTWMTSARKSIFFTDNINFEMESLTYSQSWRFRSSESFTNFKFCLAALAIGSYLWPLCNRIVQLWHATCAKIQLWNSFSEEREGENTCCCHTWSHVVQ